MNIKQLVSQMTLEEKAGLCSGEDFWHAKGIKRLGIPSVMLSDGPHGLRKQAAAADHLGLNESVTAICFPAGCAMASSFDRNLIQSIGEAIGRECQAENVSVVLGPAACIKRSPLCGRNFEYFSEDPFVSTEMAAGHIKGVQSQNVGTSLKHYLLNNQEHRRMTSDSKADERTIREIYLSTFEGAVKKGKPWTVMCSYNKINGTYACENQQYLTKVLRDEWGFDGYVVSDWGAVNNRVDSLKAGLELEMPASGGVNDKKIIDAVNNGTLDMAVLDRAVERLLRIIFKYADNKDTSAVFDYEGDDALARRAAGECAVLLKNKAALPLSKSAKAAFIGAFASTPRYQGGGSSHINAYRIHSALDAVKDVAPVVFAKGYDPKEDIVDEALISEAVKAAKACGTAVIFAGLPDSYESEGYDRSHMRMPEGQNALIHAVAQTGAKTIVVLHNGSPVEMPWIDEVDAVLEMYLGGEAVGAAAVDILYGDVNPSGKLAETFPKKLEDNPSYLYYTGEGDTVEYREGVFVGYRYYDKKAIDVLFPFGHGLSYTTFEYSRLRLDKTAMDDTQELQVCVDVTNTGRCFGKEIVQLYVKAPSTSLIRPVKELRGFEKIALAPGETKTITFTLGQRAFAYWNTQIHQWHVLTGSYDILLGASSRDIRCQAAVEVASTVTLPKRFHINSTLGDILADPEAAAIMGPVLSGFSLGGSDDTGSNDTDSGEDAAVSQEMMAAMMADMPLRTLISFSSGAIREETILQMLDAINK